MLHIKSILTFLLLCFSFLSYCQSGNQVITYNDPPLFYLVTDNFDLDEYTMPDPNDPTDYKVRHNNDFTVKLRTKYPPFHYETLDDLFEYNTFVNSGSSLSSRSKSSFVSFDFTGETTVEITCNYTNISSVKIRPLSKNIIPTIQGNKITFKVTEPAQYSVEINNNRYRNIHVFANPIEEYNFPDSDPVTFVYTSGVHFYNHAYDNLVGKKIHIKQGAVLIVPYDPINTEKDGAIELQNNDEIFIEGGGILKGELRATEKNNIKIYGRGVIECSDYPKQYSQWNSGYVYIEPMHFIRCTNIDIDGVILSDSQQFCIMLQDCNTVNINNVKVFSRVLWGDGIHMRGTSNVTINDSFIRTSDDCIAIYCSRHDGWSNYQYNSALNISTTNTLLYADVAHAIEIGWHGDHVNNTELDIYNVYFNNIDILEHDSNGYYQGAVSINCGDNVTCSNMLFRNINVEDFTSGRLFSVNVEDVGAEPVDPGRRVSYIRFENLHYNGFGENPSTIMGVNCDRNVNGVHFENFRVNGQLITKINDYSITTNRYAYNITFQEANNYSTFATPGYYRIRNLVTGKYLTAEPVKTENYNLNSDYQIWEISNPSFATYKIKNAGNTKFLENEFHDYYPVHCRNRIVSTKDESLERTIQQWKIVGVNNSKVKIINSYLRSYLTDYNNNVLSMDRNSSTSINTQDWQLIPTEGPSSIGDEGSFFSVNNSVDNKNVNVYPNPGAGLVKITATFLNENEILKMELFDITGRRVLSKEILNDETLDVSLYKNGTYYFIFTDKGGTVYTQMFIKS